MSLLQSILGAIQAIFYIGQRPPPQQQQSRPPPTSQRAAGQSNKENLNRFGKPLQTRWDDNAVNQQNAHYQDLRNRARDEGDAVARCFSESKEAYQGGDGAKAKQLSNEGKAHKAEMERLDAEASTWIFRENNQDSRPDELDLHGLYVKEAIQKTEEAIVDAQNRGDTQIRVIVGKGLHSQGSAAKLKPAIEELMIKHQLVADLDPQNAGVLVVTLNQQQGQGHGMDSGEIAQRLDNDRCIVM